MPISKRRLGRQRLRKWSDGHYYPHRAFAHEDEAIDRILIRARALGIKVYRADPETWHFKGGLGRVDITTTTPQQLAWSELSGRALGT